RDSSQAEGTVISQYPSPDAEVELGSSVDLVVARREETPLPSEPEPVPEPEPAPEPQIESQNQPEQQQSSESHEPVGQVDVPSRDGDQQKER
ncbi:MAG: PASTA domain-containing protein, partial [Selenomonadaceae bacterium]|nr:PASTA domain-containing protein [Selenomonadaceae bacterium]